MPTGLSNLEQVKQSLIDEIAQRSADHIIEENNAALLVKLINNAENATEAIAIAELGTTYKRTGFHFDKRLERMGTDIKYLKKNSDLSFETTPEAKRHILISGDNYDALRNLLITHKGKVDVIYIDPPYGKNSMGEFAQTNYDNALTRDNLLSMMYPRLFLAKQLLSDEGVIFCSIDDKNQAYLKCLFDEVFGEKNFVANIAKKGTGGRQDSKHFAIVHEYCLCYVKNDETYISGKQIKEIDPSEYPYVLPNGKKYKTQLLRKWGDGATRADRPNLYYPIYYNVEDHYVSLERRSDNDLEIFPKLSPTEDGRWRWKKETMQDNINNDIIEFKVQDGEYVPYERVIMPTEPEKRPYDTWIDDVKTNTGSSLLIKILGVKSFEYPKAVDYVKKLIKRATNNKNAVVLDFFAGSGTTAQAVLELNKEDNGNRTFILAQSNEADDKNPNGIVYDTLSKRLKRIMTGSCYDGTTDFKWNDENEPFGDNLDLYEIKSVNNAEQGEGLSPFEVIDETCYGLPAFDNVQDKIAWVCDNFEQTQNYLIEQGE